MKFIPFPEPLRSEYAERTRVAYEAKCAERVRRRGTATPPVGSSETEKDALCYRTPEGKLRPVYDPYRAAYPEGCTPGTGTVTMTFKWFPNDTGGYDRFVADFKPLA